MYKKLYRCTGLKAPWKLKKKRDLSSNRMSTRVITKKKKKKKNPPTKKKKKKKKNPLIFQEMELSSSDIKKIHIFLKERNY